MKKTLEFKAHDGEIEDIALGPDNKVSVRWLPGPTGRAVLGRPRCLRAGGDGRTGLPVLRVAAGPAGDGAALEREPARHPRQGLPLPGLPVRQGPGHTGRGVGTDNPHGCHPTLSLLPVPAVSAGRGSPRLGEGTALLSALALVCVQVWAWERGERVLGPPPAVLGEGGVAVLAVGTDAPCAVLLQVWGRGGQRWGTAALYSAGAPQTGAPPPTLLPDQMGWEEFSAAADPPLRQ